jgi:hypothetical protein
MVDTTIYIGDIAIHEPVTAFTDYIITVLGLYFYHKLSKKNDDIVTRNWSRFCGLLGLSTLLGGSSHAFFELHEGIAYKTVWLSMQIVNGLSIYFAQQATWNSLLINSKYANKWKTSYTIQLIAFIILLLIFQKYLVTIIENVIGFIPIMILHLKQKEGYYKKIGYGIMVSFITAIVHASKFSIHAYFNFNDLAHVFIMISLYIMYLGAKEKAIS